MSMPITITLLNSFHRRYVIIVFRLHVSDYCTIFLYSWLGCIVSVNIITRHCITFRVVYSIASLIKGSIALVALPVIAIFYGFIKGHWTIGLVVANYHSKAKHVVWMCTHYQFGFFRAQDRQAILVISIL